MNSPNRIASEVPRPASAGSVRLRLLAIEDTVDDHDLMLHALHRAGLSAEAERVEDEAGLRAALASQSWDAVISDHNLPGFSSREALAIVRASGLDCPFIIVSGAIGEEVAVEAMRAGADDYVMKNNLARLAPALERGLRNAEERRARRRIEERIAGIAENIPGGMLQISFEAASGSLRLPHVGVGVGELFGVPAAELQEEPGHLLEAITPLDRTTLLEAIRAAAGTFAPLRWEGRTANDAQAAPRWVLLAASPRPARAGLALWDGIALDVTHEKVVEQALRASRERLRELSAHVEGVREAERAEIARELHDEFGGLLTGLKSDAAWLARRVAGDAQALDKVGDMRSLLEAMADSARRMARSLRPSILDQGLPAALEWLARDFAERHGIACRFTCNVEELEIDPTASNTVFRAVQEALTNVVRHAGASRVDIAAFATQSELSVEVRDDGAGFAPGARDKASSFGLRGMEERVAHAGGWIEVSSTPGGGTTVMLAVPLATPGKAP